VSRDARKSTTTLSNDARKSTDTISDTTRSLSEKEYEDYQRYKASQK